MGELHWVVQATGAVLGEAGEPGQVQLLQEEEEEELLAMQQPATWAWVLQTWLGLEACSEVPTGVPGEQEAVWVLQSLH